MSDRFVGIEIVRFLAAVRASRPRRYGAQLSAHLEGVRAWHKSLTGTGRAIDAEGGSSRRRGAVHGFDHGRGKRFGIVGNGDAGRFGGWHPSDSAVRAHDRTAI
jgi:hypothetical protein